MSACSTDVFVGPDGSTADAGDASPGTPDAGGPTLSIQCAKGTCTDQICCDGATWDFSICAPPSSQSTLACQRYLACDDPTDCPANASACCATEITSGTGTSMVTTSHCAPDCAAGDVRLCQADNQCSTNNCQSYQGAPSWLKTCQ